MVAGSGHSELVIGIRIVWIAHQGSRGDGPDINWVIGKWIEYEAFLAGDWDRYPVILSRWWVAGGILGLAGRIAVCLLITCPVPCFADVFLLSGGQIASSGRIRVSPTGPVGIRRIRIVAGTQDRGDEGQG